MDLGGEKKIWDIIFIYTPTASGPFKNVHFNDLYVGLMTACAPLTSLVLGCHRSPLMKNNKQISTYIKISSRILSLRGTMKPQKKVLNDDSVMYCWDIF